MRDLIIRDAESPDTEALAGLLTELGYPTSPEEMGRRFAKISAHPAYRTLVAEHEGSVVGMTGVTIGHLYERDEGYARISAFVVSPRYRRLGVGEALLRAAESRARDLGVGTVFLNSDVRRSGAHRFYKESGYEVTGYRFSKSLGGDGR